uniref:C-type lectin domain-containing protein n=1 Tax=Panagrolaimus sp. ES5 TaxID=591445 RepID=A0AC34GRQ8_9BILA
MICLLLLFLFAFLNLTFATCPNGSTQSISDPTKCYTFVKEKTNWFAADQNCSAIGGSLVSLHDMFENMVVSGDAGSIFKDAATSDFWIGAIYNSLSPNKWSWIDKSPFDFNDWDKGQPQNTTDSVCASVIMNGAKWQSKNCFEEKPFVCLLQPKPSICVEGWTYFNYTNFCYKVIVKKTTWYDAEMACVSEKAHLVSIHSWQEILFATELAAPYSTNKCDWNAQTWIGMSTQDKNVHWEWTDGTPFDYIDWAPGEPNNPGLENCGQILSGIPCTGMTPAVLYNFFCNNLIDNFICKKAP